MNIGVALSLLAFAVVLLWGVGSVVRDLVMHDVVSEPIFRDQGPLFHDQGVEHQGARSQFAWQSRSHFRVQD
jgi:hypothetical protein